MKFTSGHGYFSLSRTSRLLGLLCMLIAASACAQAKTEAELCRLAELERWDEIKEFFNDEEDSPESVFLRFRGAELALEAGETALAEEWLHELATPVMQKNLSAAHQARVITMLEYLIRNAPDQVEITLESARKLNSYAQQSAAAQLDRVAILLNRAVFWHDSGMAEWTELTTLLHEFLQQFRDGGEPVIAIRRVLLHSRVMNLAGDHNGAAELLTQFLRFYYPECLAVATYRKPLPLEACRLLVRLGNCYAEMARRANDPAEKKRFFSQAAIYWMNAASGTPEESEEYTRLLQALTECQEALALLGYQLKLPAFLPAAVASGRESLYQMLAERRYRALLTVVEAQLAQLPQDASAYQESLALALLARCGLEEFAEVPALAEKLNSSKLEVETLTRLFRGGTELMNRNHAREALHLFRVISESGQLKHPDYLRSLRNMARIAAEEEQPEVALAAFDRMLALLPENDAEYWQTQYNALLALFQLKQYSNVRSRYQKFNLTAAPRQEHARIRLLAARSAMELDDTTSAMRELQELRYLPDIPPNMQAAAILLAAHTAAADEGPNELSCQLLAEYLQTEPDSAAAREAIELLLEWYRRQPELADYQMVGNFLCRRADFGESELQCLRMAARECHTRQSPEAALEVFRELKDNTALTPATLLQITEVIRQDYAATLPKASAQLLAGLLHSRLKNNQDPLVCELRFRCLEALVTTEADADAVELAVAALAETPPFRYEETRLFYAKALIGVGESRQAREIFQEILGRDHPEWVGACNLGLARSWQAEGNDQRAIATAWNIVPPNVLGVNPEQFAEAEAALLLIRDCALRCASTEDLQEAESLLRDLRENQKR